MNLYQTIKNTGKKILLTTLIASTLLGSAFSQEKTTSEIKQHALVFCADNYKNGTKGNDLIGKGTKNTYLISIANIYDALKNSGFDKNNIQINYFDGQPDYNETKDSDKISSLELEKGSQISQNKGTKSNLESSIKTLSNQVEENDEILIYMTGHGIKNYSNGTINFEFTPLPDSDMPGTNVYENISPKELSDLIASVPGHKTVVLDFCYSGAFGKTIAEQGSDVYTATDETTFSMRSRESQFGRELIISKANPETDLNNDGEVSWNEAYQKTQQTREPILLEHKNAGHFYKLEMVPGQEYKPN